MLHKGIDLALLSVLVFGALFLIGHVQDVMPAGARKLSMKIAPIPGGIVGEKPSLTTLLMIALILLLGDGLAGGNMLGGGSRKGARKSFPFPAQVIKGKRGSRRSVVGSGGLSALTRTDEKVPMRSAYRGGVISVGGDRCGMQKLKPQPQPSLISTPGTESDMGGAALQAQQDALGAAAVEANALGSALL